MYFTAHLFFPESNPQIDRILQTLTRGEFSSALSSYLTNPTRGRKAMVEVAQNQNRISAWLQIHGCNSATDLHWNDLTKTQTFFQEMIR